MYRNWLGCFACNQSLAPCRFTAPFLLYLSNPKLPSHETFGRLVQVPFLKKQKNGMTHSPQEFSSLSQEVKGQSSSKSSKVTAIKRTLRIGPIYQFGSLPIFPNIIMTLFVSLGQDSLADGAYDKSIIAYLL